MQTTRYRFEKVIESATEGSSQWLIDEFKSILESDKEFTRKADYIGYSIASIDAKVASIDEEIQELQQLKKNLKAAKDIALTTGVKVFEEYGIEKLEGAGISSITLTKPSTKTKETLEVDDEELLIKAGYYKRVLDTDALQVAYKSADPLVMEHCTLIKEQIDTPAKLKINKRRAKASNNLDDMEVAS